MSTPQTPGDTPDNSPDNTDGHAGGHGEPVDENLPARDDLYANPGLPEHQWRPTDVDPKKMPEIELSVSSGNPPS